MVCPVVLKERYIAILSGKHVIIDELQAAVELEKRTSELWDKNGVIDLFELQKHDPELSKLIMVARNKPETHYCMENSLLYHVENGVLNAV
uniref:Uncharacterized protein n=1 Tax=Romanomermis culicivorax TaxID=13658 RepID=A0A915JLQ1_ROMCU